MDHIKEQLRACTYKPDKPHPQTENLQDLTRASHKLRAALRILRSARTQAPKHRCDHLTEKQNECSTANDKSSSKKNRILLRMLTVEERRGTYSLIKLYVKPT